MTRDQLAAIQTSIMNAVSDRLNANDRDYDVVSSNLAIAAATLEVAAALREAVESKLVASTPTLTLLPEPPPKVEVEVEPEGQGESPSPPQRPRGFRRVPAVQAPSPEAVPLKTRVNKKSPPPNRKVRVVRPNAETLEAASRIQPPVDNTLVQDSGREADVMEGDPWAARGGS